MSAADELREAAALMRVRAEGSVPGPWPVEDDNHLALPMAKLPYDPDIKGMTRASGSYELAGPNDATTRHIASWHPAVALAVADWLDDAAIDMSEVYDYPEPPNPLALAVARAYLGVSDE